MGRQMLYPLPMVDQKQLLGLTNAMLWFDLSKSFEPLAARDLALADAQDRSADCMVGKPIGQR